RLPAEGALVGSGRGAARLLLAGQRARARPRHRAGGPAPRRPGRQRRAPGPEPRAAPGAGPRHLGRRRAGRLRRRAHRAGERRARVDPGGLARLELEPRARRGAPRHLARDTSLPAGEVRPPAAGLTCRGSPGPHAEKAQPPPTARRITTATVITAVASHPKMLSHGPFTRAPMIVELFATSMTTTSRGGARTT